MRLLVAALLAAFALPLAAAPVEGYRIVKTLPHNPTSYTEGFFYLDGLFYEGTGLNGHSRLLAEDPATGRPVREHSLDPQYFGEGIINVGPYIYEWSWKAHTGFVYRRSDFTPVRQFTYTGEGWGMTRNSTEIITSDGSSTLTFRNPDTFAPTHTLTVHDGPALVTNVNELEWVKGEIYANIWMTDRIARISPTDGHVIAWVDLAGLMPASKRVSGDAVLNGIAYDSTHDRLFVTGKLWPNVFQIRLTPHDTKH